MRIPTIVVLCALWSGVGIAQQPSDSAPPTELIDRRFTGDFNAMKQRRLIRVGVAYNRTHYFIDKGVQRGLSYEAFKLLEDQLNAGIKVPKDRIHVAFVPLSRDAMTSALLEGRVDLLAANITITPDRRAKAWFSNPIRRNVSEVVVAGPGVAAVATAEDLAGKEVLVREHSLYQEHLTELNARLKTQGRPAVTIRVAANLEDDDVLEMVNAGMAPYTVVDDFMAEFWVQVFTGLQVQKSATIATGDEIAIAMRPNSPELKAAIDAFVKTHGAGTLHGNMLLKRYLSNTRFARNATTPAGMQRFQEIVALFRTYGEKYDMDYLLMAAQGFQESGLNHSVKSPVGAIGVMQVMPATGKELNVGDIAELEPNIHAGVKYMRFMVDTYFKNDPMDRLNKGLMAFASYNAGPNRIRQLRAETKKRGLDPNLWFNNVEQVVSDRIGRETVTYVSNIYKYYVAYTLAMQQMQERRAAKKPGP
jgi:membrane-bound lytic murein transglycosylase MltF